MKTLKTVIATLGVAALLMPLAVFGVIYSGAYNVAATSGHWPVTRWLLNELVHQSVAARAETIEVPAFGGRQQVLAGAANYKAMCAGCHAAPGVEQGLPGTAMSPQPPRLDQATEEMTPAQLFWVIKHGIKATGMPAWGPSHSDEEIWSMVAFIRQLPQMSATEYARTQQAANTAGMGHHGHDGEAHADRESDAHDENSAAREMPEATHESGENEAAHGTEGHSH